MGWHKYFENPKFVLNKRSDRCQNVTGWLGILFDWIDGQYFKNKNTNEQVYLPIWVTFVLPFVNTLEPELCNN